MSKFTPTIILSCLCWSLAIGQPDLSTLQLDWQKAGLIEMDKPDYMEVNVLDYGFHNDGVTLNDQPLKSLLNQFRSSPVVFNFPAGTYRFQTTFDLNSNMVLRGEGANVTHFIFDLEGKFKNCINIIGSPNPNFNYILDDVQEGDMRIRSMIPPQLQVGSKILIISDDTELVESFWAKNSTGQFATVVSIEGNYINLSESIRRSHLASKNARFYIINSARNVGIECLSLERVDFTDFQTTNINFNYAYNCWVKGIESKICNHAHVQLRNAYHVVVEDSYLHDATNFGSGGDAYGVELHFNSSLCLIQNNIFRRLRHAMLLQAGANGNVITNNYSQEPHWENVFRPKDSAGDLVLHGNYAYANLLESNVVQNIVVDASHGQNGPKNTFHRNRAKSYGILIEPTTPSSDGQILSGNEVVNNDLNNSSSYLLSGAQFQYGNNINGTLLPFGTTPLQELSYFRPSSKPGMGYPNAFNAQTIVAESNFLANTFTQCKLPDAVACAISMLITNNATVKGRLEATKDIRTSGTVTVAAGDTLVLSAGEEIVLEEGFVSESGSDFFAEIGGCTQGVDESTVESRTRPVEGKDWKANFEIYPNPTIATATIALDQPFPTAAEIRVYNWNGQLVLQRRIAPYQAKINIEVAELTPGLYTVALTSEQQALSKTLVVMR